MENLTFTAFDIETATSHSASLCQIGFVVVQEGQIIKEETYLVQPPGNEYDARHSSIHGIDALRTKDKPIFPDVWEMIKDTFTGSLLVAHNSSFDLNVLTSTLFYYSLRQHEFNCECTYKMSGLKLSALAESLQLILSKHHDALCDARICAHAYICLKNGTVPNHNLIKEAASYNPFEGHEKLTGNILKPNLNIQNTSNPFYSKKVVFTGVLQTITREAAAKKIQDLGADVDTCVNKRTNYVVVGQGAGPSKLKKIDDFNSSGSNIKILNEYDFLSMVKS